MNGTKWTWFTRSPLEEIDIHEARTHPSRRVEKAARREGFIIAKAGKPMVKVCRWAIGLFPSRNAQIHAWRDRDPGRFRRDGPGNIERSFYGEGSISSKIMLATLLPAARWLRRSSPADLGAFR